MLSFKIWQRNPITLFAKPHRFATHWSKIMRKPKRRRRWEVQRVKCSEMSREWVYSTVHRHSTLRSGATRHRGGCNEAHILPRARGGPVPQSGQKPKLISYKPYGKSELSTSILLLYRMADGQSRNSFRPGVRWHFIDSSNPRHLLAEYKDYVLT